MLSDLYFHTAQAKGQETHLGENGQKEKPMKVFLVDDSMVIRQRLKRMLADVQEVVVIGEAGDGLAATTDAILALKPDAVLLDIHMYDGNGIDVLQTLKKAAPTMAVIILTNYPFPQYRSKCLEAGADFFFVKSTEFDQVIPALKQLMGRVSGSTTPLPIE